MMSTFSWKNLSHPILALSPMADMTDSAFCRVVKSLASPIVFREMVSAEAVVRGNEKTLGMTAIHPDEQPLIQQIFGSDPDVIAQAACIIVERYAPQGIDLNMGCPVYKLVNNFNGASLMREPQRADAIVRAIKAAVSVPVSVKIRLGWDDPTTCLDFVRVLEQAGADLITIHGRTRAQGYSGAADWHMIGKAKERVSIPVLVNGDIHTADRLIPALQASGCDGALIARGALGNPWIFKEMETLLGSRGLQPALERTLKGAATDHVVSLEERIRVVKLHAGFHVEQYGPRGMITLRKHLTWYFKGTPDFKQFRASLHQVATKQELDNVLETILCALAS